MTGDVLAIYTDWISEAFDTAGEEYGTDRLATAIARSSAADAAAICHAVVKDVTRFSRYQGFDDRTLVIIQALLAEATQLKAFGLNQVVDLPCGGL
jgi:serine phosphatase RsbU (regulator of sigma subunit)